LRLAPLPIGAGRSCLALAVSNSELGRNPNGAQSLRIFCTSRDDLEMCEQAAERWLAKGYATSIWVPAQLLAPEEVQSDARGNLTARTTRP